MDVDKLPSKHVCKAFIKNIEDAAVWIDSDNQVIGVKRGEITHSPALADKIKQFDYSDWNRFDFINFLKDMSYSIDSIKGWENGL